MRYRKALIMRDYTLMAGLNDRAEQTRPRLAFQQAMEQGVPFAQWQNELRGKLRELLGLPDQREVNHLCWESESESEDGEALIRRFSYSPEPKVMIPAYLLTPMETKGRLPLAVCLQGHSTGMHISIGRAMGNGDRIDIKGGRDFAVQAVRQGCAALVIEQRAFGERHYGSESLNATRCHHAAMHALMTGRTLLGERVLDVMSGIDIAITLPEIDPTRIFCIGNSGGGTVSYYTAAMDERVAMAVPSCAICEYRSSILPIHHCACNYIPHALEWFEMSDLGGLIAPRPLVIVAGRKDPIFPYAGVQQSLSNLQAIYEAASAPARCHCVTGAEGHQFYPGEAWPVIMAELEQLAQAAAIG